MAQTFTPDPAVADAMDAARDASTATAPWSDAWLTADDARAWRESLDRDLQSDAGVSGDDPRWSGPRTRYADDDF